MRVPKLPEKLIILGLTLLAFGLRVYRLDVQSFWLDEAWTIYSITLPLGDLLHLLQTEVPKPPFHYFTAFQWIKFVGQGEFALRFYSVIFGVAAVPLTFRLGKALGDNRVGLLAALLLAVSPYQIWHSQDARMYSIFTAAAVMSMWGFVNFLRRRGGWRWWLVYVVGTEWAIATHYHALVVIGIQGLFLLLTWRRHWRIYLAWGGTLLLIFLIYTPWLLFGGALLQSYLNWIEQPATLWDTYRRGAIVYSVGELTPPAQAVPLTIVFVIFYGLGLIYAARRRWGSWRGSEMLAFLLAYTLAPNLAAWLYGELRTPVYLERYLIPIQVGYLLAVAMGLLAIVDGLPVVLRRLTRKQAPLFNRSAYLLAGLALLALTGISGWVLGHYYFDPAYARPDWRAVAQKVQAFEQPGDAIIITGEDGDKAFNLYYEGGLPIYLDFNTPAPTEEEARDILAGIAAAHRRIWYTPYGVDIDPLLERWLAENTYPAWHRWLGRKRLALYGSQVTTNRLESLQATFAGPTGQGPTLISAALPADPTPAGDLLPLTLTWQTGVPIPADYQLSLRLTNRQGDIFAQSDWPPLTATRPTSAWVPNQPIVDRRSLWLPADLPPGRYVLQLVVYDPSTGQSLGQPVAIDNIEVEAAQIVAPLEALAISNFIDNPRPGNPHLVGYVAPESIQPGQEMWLWLYWQATAPPAAGTVRLTLTGHDQAVTADYPLADSVGPLDSWQPGQVRRAVYHLPTSPSLAGDQAELSLSLIAPTGVAGEEIPVTTVRLDSRPRQFEAPAIDNPLDFSFGQPPELTLLGYDLLQSRLEPGQTLPVTLYWRAEADMAVNYTVFVQLLDRQGQVVAQIDRQPRAGAAPTTTWLPGEILTDPYTIPLPADLPPSSYRLIAGLYDAATGERLFAASGNNFVELGEVTVE